MSDANVQLIIDRAPYIREKRSEPSPRLERMRLLLAIEDANLLGFTATRSALIAMLRELEAIH